MSRRKHARAALVVAVAVLAAAVAVPAFAAAPSKVTQTTLGGGKFVPNRYIQDGLHFKLDRVNIKKGGTLTLVDKSKAPHSFSLVKTSQVPQTLRGVDGCFEKGPCGKLAVEHGAVDPVTGEEKDPDTPLVNAGKAGFNQPGDSVLIPPGGKTKIKITSAGPLYYICAIHPWMQGAINAKPVR
jgi:plastocyanin